MMEPILERVRNRLCYVLCHTNIAHVPNNAN